MPQPKWSSKMQWRSRTAPRRGRIQRLTQDQKSYIVSPLCAARGGRRPAEPAGRPCHPAHAEGDSTTGRAGPAAACRRVQGVAIRGANGYTSPL